MTLLDDASINSRLFQKNGINYYKQVNHIRKKLKEKLRVLLCLEHRNIFLLNNTTHCLLNVLYGLNMHSTSLLINKGSYPPYQQITTEKFSKKIKLLTHIDPQTGRICTLDNTDFILDAAQSIGTTYHHCKAISSKILFFPLHKHLAIEAGLGVLCVQDENLYPEISNIASISERGTVNINVYEHALSSCTQHSDIFNIAYFSFTNNEVTALAQDGLKCITPTQSHTPFVVLETTLDIKLTPYFCDQFTITMKKLKTNTYRFTCYKAGNLLSNPVNCNLQLLKYIKGVL